MGKKKDFLLFIDTNIYLDFYRTRTESGLKLLKRLDGLHDKIISTYQVEMEFKKNRQRVILDSLKSLEVPKKVSVPAFLSEAKSAKALAKDLSDAEKRIKRLHKRLRNALLDPTTADEVYKTAQRIFRHHSPHNLTRDRKVRFSIRRLAFKRFILGYPPRKSNDTSIGDAMNWEWIVECSKSNTSDIIVVSRDSDYGVSHGDESYLNDWLLQELRERASRKRKVLLTSKLSAALKTMAVAVTVEEEREEQDLITPSVDKPSGRITDKMWLDMVQRINESTTSLWRALSGDLPKSE